MRGSPVSSIVYKIDSLVLKTKISKHVIIICCCLSSKIAIRVNRTSLETEFR